MTQYKVANEGQSKTISGIKSKFGKFWVGVKESLAVALEPYGAIWGNSGAWDQVENKGAFSPEVSQASHHQ